MDSTMSLYSEQFCSLFRPILNLSDFSSTSSDSGVGGGTSTSISSRASDASDFAICSIIDDGGLLSPTDLSESLETLCSDIPSENPVFMLDESEPEVMLEAADDNTSLYIENEFQRVVFAKRSSSLKSTCTPPGTPGPSKMVRFADAFGLELATVKHITNQDRPPHIPASVRNGLCLSSSDSDSDAELHDMPPGDPVPQFRVKRTYRPCFPQPGNNANFLRRVFEQNICLESATFDDIRHQLSGYAAVRNLTYVKKVFLRYTFNNWYSYNDIPATYLEPFQVDRKSLQAAGLYSVQQIPEVDRFQFFLYVPDTISYDEKLQFALLYRTDRFGEEYWDNNFGQNYACMMIEILQGVK